MCPQIFSNFGRGEVDYVRVLPQRYALPERVLKGLGEVKPMDHDGLGNILQQIRRAHSSEPL